MLKQPNQLQIDHSATLSAVIRNSINNNDGWISFEQYMNLALYAPGLGYYSAGTSKIGDEGDFVTAPTLGKQFAGCLARQCSEILGNLGGDQPSILVEFGAGTGQLALDLLEYLHTSNSLPQQYLIIETSADLQARQQELIRQARPDLFDRVSWADQMPQNGICGVIIANELLDALPVKRFEINQHGEAMEVGVSMKGEEFDWHPSQHSIAKEFQQRLDKFGLSPGYQSEIGSYAESWVRTIGDCLKIGAIILIDYGFPQSEFYHWDRIQGTFMCHYQHTAHDNPFYYPGVQDITAHVDFSAVANAGCDAGLEVAGYCNQGSFLLSLGLLDSLQQIQNHDAGNLSKTSADSNSINIAQEIKKLTLPHEMGELFKVMALTRNHTQQLSGFDMQNHKGRL